MARNETLLENKHSVLRDTDFYEDDPQYPEYTEVEAEETVFPLEYDLLLQTSDNEESKENKTENSSFSFLLFTSELGEVTIRSLKYIFKKLSPVFVLPLLFLYNILRFILKKLKELIKSQKVKDLLRPSLIKDIKSIRKASKKRQDDSTAFFLRNSLRVFYARISNRESIITTLVNLLVPLCVISLILIAYNSAKDKIYALEVFYENESLGYIENENVFEKAKSEAVSLLSSADASALEIKQPVYKLSRVNISDLSNSSMISEKLIANQDIPYTRACGIYIDGEFLCAVKNESDAVSVFSSIIAPYKAKAEKDTMVSFVEEIEYVQGYYEEEKGVIWDLATLQEILSKPKSEKQVYTVKKGDTAKSVATAHSLTVKQLKALNVGKDFSSFKKITRLVVAPETNYVRVKVMKTATRTETLKFQKVEQKSSTLAKGTKKTTQKGQNGQKLITELITYIDGKKSFTSTVSEVQTKAPVNEIILVGTKTSSISSSQSYGGSVSYRQFIWPTRGAYAVSSHYGYRSASISGWSYHGGIDIVLGSGSSAGIPVVASASGTVVIANSGWRGYGHTVVIDHGGGYRTRYAHMYPGSISVRVGQKVYQGQQIGRIGSTRNSTGPHLHFELLLNGRKINPYPYIR